MRLFLLVTTFLVAISANAVTVTTDNRTVCQIGSSCTYSDGSGGYFNAADFATPYGDWGYQESLAYDDLGNGEVGFSASGFGAGYVDYDGTIDDLRLYGVRSSYNVYYTMTEDTDFSIEGTIYGSDNLSTFASVSFFVWDSNNIFQYSHSLEQSSVTEIDPGDFALAFYDTYETTLLAGYTLRIRGITNLKSMDYSTAGYDLQGTFTSAAVPVPAAAWLFGSALAGLGWLRRKKRSNPNQYHLSENPSS